MNCINKYFLPLTVLTTQLCLSISKEPRAHNQYPVALYQAPLTYGLSDLNGLFDKTPRSRDAFDLSNSTQLLKKNECSALKRLISDLMQELSVLESGSQRHQICLERLTDILNWPDLSCSQLSYALNLARERGNTQLMKHILTLPTKSSLTSLVLDLLNLEESSAKPNKDVVTFLHTYELHPCSPQEGEVLATNKDLLNKQTRFALKKILSSLTQELQCLDGNQAPSENLESVLSWPDLPSSYLFTMLSLAREYEKIGLMKYILDLPKATDFSLASMRGLLSSEKSRQEKPNQVIQKLLKNYIREHSSRSCTIL